MRNVTGLVITAIPVNLTHGVRGEGAMGKIGVLTMMVLVVEEVSGEPF